MGTRDSNSATTPMIDLTGATTSTISFYWTTTGTYVSAHGRFPQIQYSNDGNTFATIGTISVPSSNSSNPRPYTYFTETIELIGGYAFTANSVFRVVGDNDVGGGNAPLIFDDFSVTSNAIGVPEPSSTVMLIIGGMMSMIRRR